MDKQNEIYLYSGKLWGNKNETWDIMLNLIDIVFSQIRQKKYTLYNSDPNKIYTRQNHFMVLDIGVKVWDGSVVIDCKVTEGIFGSKGNVLYVD